MKEYTNRTGDTQSNCVCIVYNIHGVTIELHNNLQFEEHEI